MKKDEKILMKNEKKKEHRVFKPRKKRSSEEDAAIKYLQAQYNKIIPDEIKSFKDFPLSQKTLMGLKENNYIIPTDIQKQAIGFALQGKDILGAAKTGSGKTLAFLVPIFEILFCKKWTRLDRVGALVISPTRELAYQIYEVLRKVGRFHDFSAALIIGGQNLKFERKRMDQINILICTPGRLLQHMDENPLFDCSNLQILVLDEADRCLDMGFETTMNAIIENLPPDRQTLLFSATQTKSVKDLSRLSLSYPTYVAPHEQASTVTPEALQQSYIVCGIYEKLGILWSFIRNHLKQKVIVFMATCKQVKYTYELFCKLRPGVSLLALYGSLHQQKREKIYQNFCRKSNVVLFATDLASRGLDFPKVNWVIQYDCPENVDTYIHRAGRTARGVLGKGEGLLILLPGEENFVEDLKKSKIPIKKISVDCSKVVTPQRKIESLLSDNEELKQMAQRAFVSYIKSVFLMKNKCIFNVQCLDTDSYARSLGLIVPPIIKFMSKYNNTNITHDIEKTSTADAIKKLKTKASEDGGSELSDFESDNIPVLQKGQRNKVKKEPPKFDFHNKNRDSDDDKDFLKEKRRYIAIDTTPPEVETRQYEKEAKPLTKAAVVKKILKQKIKVNTLVKFTESGEAIDDDKKDLKSELAKQLNESRMDIDTAKELLREEDKYDKIRFSEKVKSKHKEKKRKLKNKNKDNLGDKDEFGSNDESDGPDLSWLPDPDKVYDNQDDHSRNSPISGSDNQTDALDSEDFETDAKYHRPTKRKLLENKKDVTQESVIPRKLKKIDEASLSVQEIEALAMQLLQSKRK